MTSMKENELQHLDDGMMGVKIDEQRLQWTGRSHGVHSNKRKGRLWRWGIDKQVLLTNVCGQSRSDLQVMSKMCTGFLSDFRNTREKVRGFTTRTLGRVALQRPTTSVKTHGFFDAYLNCGRHTADL